MQAIQLNGQWKLKSTKSDEWIDAIVPGTVYQDLYRAGKAPDPYYRDNEDAIVPIFLDDYEYRREFQVEAGLLDHDRVILCCQGLDTLATLWINGEQVARTDNMHRTYRFEVKDKLVIGTNEIRVRFDSPVNYIHSVADQSKGMAMMSGKGVELIRKAQCMFGWDWGMVLPDSGIWRDIAIETYDQARIEDVAVLQDHQPGKVTLTVKVGCEIWAQAEYQVNVKVAAPDGQEIQAAGPLNAENSTAQVELDIDQPSLWWPNGFGQQPLYQLEVSLTQAGQLIETRTQKIGLRTITVRREMDQWGESFEFIVNGRPLFIKGANLVIEDSLIGRYSRERTEQMVKNSVAANFNAIRVWGGALYPSDDFFDLCDQYGLVVYHDLMFACNFYPADDKFIENIVHEVKDNVRRARGHACMGVWSGNNEIEIIFGLATSQQPEIVEMRKLLGLAEFQPEEQQSILADYQKVFYQVLPPLMAELDPQTTFVNSSPSTKNPQATSAIMPYENGDAHYYTSYDGMAPYTKIRSMNFRFVSEMGFQSFPSIKTIRSFTLEEDRLPETPVMLKHQKSNSGNQIIGAYMLQDYKQPRDFERHVYASQILAGEVLRYEVEHLRRNEGRSMGVLTWQLNDCWPVVSWAGVDYYGRWKAQQYYAKRAFEPILVAALDEGTQVDLYVINDTPEDVSGSLRWKLLDNRSTVIESSSQAVTVKSCRPEAFIHLDFSTALAGEALSKHYLEYEFCPGEQVVSRGTTLFVKPKDFALIDPELALAVREEPDAFLVNVRAAGFAKSVGLDLSEADAVFSDNYFDLSAGEPHKIRVEKTSLSQPLTLAQFKDQLTVTSVFDIA